MPQNVGERDVDLRAPDALDDMEIGAAYPCPSDLDDDIVLVLETGIRDFLDLQEFGSGD